MDGLVQIVSYAATSVIQRTAKAPVTRQMGSAIAKPALHHASVT